MDHFFLSTIHYLFIKNIHLSCLIILHVLYNKSLYSFFCLNNKLYSYVWVFNVFIIRTMFILGAKVKLTDKNVTPTYNNK